MHLMFQQHHFSKIKILGILLIYILTISFEALPTSKNTQKIVGEWSLMQFEEVRTTEGKRNVFFITYDTPVSFQFQSDLTLKVKYGTGYTEDYHWHLKRQRIKIDAANPDQANSHILGQFDFHFIDHLSQLFLQRKNKPHHGIMLRKL